MPTVQNLKKQLRGINSTQKLTKAMKTASTVKFSKLNSIYAKHSLYGESCRQLFEMNKSGLLEMVKAVNPDAPTAIIVIAGNKGLCGNFNSEILRFAKAEIEKQENAVVVACNKKAISFFESKKIKTEKDFVFSDVPTFDEAAMLLEEIIGWRILGKISDVHIIYPKYVNMMLQKPTLSNMFSDSKDDFKQEICFLPDKETVVKNMATDVFAASFYSIVLEAAIGAQAATLMTMRSAFETATEYKESLEKQINRIRQNAVTADVLETFAEQKDN